MPELCGPSGERATGRCDECDGSGTWPGGREFHNIGCSQRGLPDDRVNHPQHYNTVPGVECIDVVEHFSFNRGNAMKYLWRAGAKGDLVEDLRKAIWYIQREIDGQTKS